MDNKQNETDEKDEFREKVLDEYKHALHAMHDSLDEIKDDAKHLGGELENLIGDLEGEEKAECQRLIHTSVLAYQRVDRGDHQILRGL